MEPNTVYNFKNQKEKAATTNHIKNHYKMLTG